MFGFSCFNAHIHSHKPKKTGQVPAEAMQKILEDCTLNQASKDLANAASLNPLLKDHGDNNCDNKVHNIMGAPSAVRGWKSEEISGKYNMGSEIEVHQAGHIKKSRSLGCELDCEGRISGSNDMEDATDQGYSCDDSHDPNVLVIQSGTKNLETNIPSQYQDAIHSESLQVSSDMVNNESIFSIGDPLNLEKEGHENSDIQLSVECAGDYGDHMSRTIPVMVKSRSMPNMGASKPTSEGHSPLAYLRPRSMSAEDLNVIEIRQRENLIQEVGSQVRHDLQRVHTTHQAQKNNCEITVEDGFESYNYSGSAKDWIMPVMEEASMLKKHEGEYSEHQWDDLPGREFKIKWIEKWVDNLQHCSSLEETDDLLHGNDQVRRVSDVMDGFVASKLDDKVTPGMEIAKKYISSLNSMATTAQLANHGLVVIPFLSAFVSLRVLNLSGNAIVRITAGALPRGLHVLNLSKNNISTIEGLRELSRLRVLDLSYNRIFRIGHGLASCSSLKELYIAGNKISEVEGLHRLLKLTILDLRFNKISTAKCLGQLAANYNSLQAISLEGNPSQKNVGDEHLKKQLQGLLPHLAYYNRQPIKVGSLKDGADRSTRLGTSSHQFDRGHRFEHKSIRKSTYGLAAHKPSSSSTHGRKSQGVVSPKRPKGRYGRLPPAGVKATMHHHNNYFDFSNKLHSMKLDLSMRRSRSEGTLGVL